MNVDCHLFSPRCGVCWNRHGQAQVPNWQREGHFWQSPLLQEGCGRCLCRDQMSEVLQESAGQSPARPYVHRKNFPPRWILIWRMRSARHASSDKDLTFAGLHSFSGVSMLIQRACMLPLLLPRMLGISSPGSA